MWKAYLCFVLVTLYTTFRGDAKCGRGEVLDRCPLNCNDSCPKRDDEFVYCRRPRRSNCSSPKCVCQLDYRRAANGTCIPTESCPPFTCSKPNEEYNSCPPYCPNDSCSEVKPNGMKCPLYLFENIYLLVPCKPACRCKPTFLRNNGICVPYDNCSTLEETEAAN